MTEGDWLNKKFLQKLKDDALLTKFDPVPKDLMEEYWNLVMFMRGIQSTLNYYGWEIRKKDEG